VNVAFFPVSASNLIDIAVGPGVYGHRRAYELRNNISAFCTVPAGTSLFGEHIMPRTPKKPSDQVRRVELAKHKLKLQNLRKELGKLKQSLKNENVRNERLEAAVKYLTNTAESGAPPNGEGE
jgi:hypothetical protein